ncbi:hypothetical protein EVA_11886 [gut metagenome]|uniref:Uncharacterized protein n=1 Tax=gut metagenome TaxID=749906 RepID=J9FZK2_9ZZZZ
MDFNNGHLQKVSYDKFLYRNDQETSWVDKIEKDPATSARPSY